MTKSATIKMVAATPEQLAHDDARRKSNDKRFKSFMSKLHGRHENGSKVEFVPTYSLREGMAVAEIMQQMVFDAGYDADIFVHRDFLMGKSLFVYIVGAFLAEASSSDRWCIVQDVDNSLDHDDNLEGVFVLFGEAKAWCQDRIDALFGLPDPMAE